MTIGAVAAVAAVGGLALAPVGPAQAFDGANPPGCHYQEANATLCKGGYHINMRKKDDPVHDAASLYEIPDGQDLGAGQRVWHAGREYHSGGAKETAEFWTYIKRPGFYYKAVLEVDVDAQEGPRQSYKFELDPETDYCYSTVDIMVRPVPGEKLFNANGLKEDAHNSDAQPGDCNLK